MSAHPGSFAMPAAMGGIGWSLAAPRTVACTNRGSVAMREPLAAVLFGLSCLAGTIHPAGAQDMMRYLDLTSPAMTQAEMTRSEVQAALAAASAEHPAD